MERIRKKVSNCCLNPIHHKFMEKLHYFISPAKANIFDLITSE